MGMLATIFGILGLIVGIDSWIMVVVAAFRCKENNVLWGVICLVTGVGSVVFWIVHWQDGKKSFFVFLLCIVLYVLAGVFGAIAVGSAVAEAASELEIEMQAVEGADEAGGSEQ